MNELMVEHQHQHQRQLQLQRHVQQQRADRQQRQTDRINLLKSINLQKSKVNPASDEVFPLKTNSFIKPTFSTTSNISYSSLAPAKKVVLDSSKTVKNQKPIAPNIVLSLKNITTTTEPTKTNKNRKSMVPNRVSSLKNITKTTEPTKTNENRKSIVPNRVSSLKNGISLKPVTVEPAKFNYRKSIAPKGILPTKNVSVTNPITSNAVKTTFYRKSIAPKDNTCPTTSLNTKSKLNNKTFEKLSLNGGVSLKQDQKFVGLFPKTNMTTFEALAKTTNHYAKPKVPNSNLSLHTMKKVKELDTSNVKEVKKTEVRRCSKSTIERLSKPRIVNKSPVSLKNYKEPKKIVARHKIKVSEPEILENKSQLRRSLSTVHFQRLGTPETRKCIHRSASSGNLMRKKMEDKLQGVFPSNGYILTVESERKKYNSFLSPLQEIYTPKLTSNTPKPCDLKNRLNEWLKKRGKTLSSYHHLKCFGLKYSAKMKKNTETSEIDEENKENVEVIDDDSFNENLSGDVKDLAHSWRRTSSQFSESPCVAQPSPIDARKTNILTELTPKNKSQSSMDPLVSEALLDLLHLINEDYSWLQCAEWLRVIIRDCGDNVKNVIAYWECRAALEQKRGDFFRTIDCFENAQQHSVQPSNPVPLDNLLSKFHKLNLDPNNMNALQVQKQKSIDVNNMRKTSIFQFAVKHQSGEETSENPRFVATPVRRSSRLSTVNESSSYNKQSSNFNKYVKPTVFTRSAQKIQNSIPTPVQKRENPSSVTKSGRKHLVQLCDSLRQFENDPKQTLIFLPNKALSFNDCV